MNEKGIWVVYTKKSNGARLHGYVSSNDYIKRVCVLVTQAELIQRTEKGSEPEFIINGNTTVSIGQEAIECERSFIQAVTSNHNYVLLCPCNKQEFSPATEPEKG